MIAKTIKGAFALLKGLSVTFRIFFTRPVTMQYPEEKREPYPRYRGAHRLLLDEEGKDRCIACGLCSRVCPAQVITVKAGEGEDKKKYPVLFKMDMGRCIFCGYCVENCPKNAIVMSPSYELSVYRREDLTFDKERLVAAGK